MKGVSGLKAGHSKVIYFITDALSTVRDVVRGTDGAVMASYEFDEYGRRLATSESGVSTQKTFVGGMSVQDEVADTGLMMMGHRFYEPFPMGRFINRDPIGFDGGLNLYEYANSQPLAFTDPLGLKSWLDPLGVLNGIKDGLLGALAGVAIGFIAAILLPEAIVAGIGVGLTAWFALQFTQTTHDICSGLGPDGKPLSPFQRSSLLGQNLMALLTLGLSRIPPMRIGLENVPGYFAMNPKGRLGYEMDAWYQPGAYQQGAPFRFSLLGIIKALFTPEAWSTGPTPGGRVGIGMGRNGTLMGGEAASSPPIIRVNPNPTNLVDNEPGEWMVIDVPNTPP